MRKRLNSIICYFINTIAFLLLLYLLMQSLFTDVRLNDIGKVYFVGSYKLVQVLGIVGLLGMIMLIHRFVRLSDKSIFSIIILISLINFGYILFSQNIPITDQYSVMDTASQMWKGNYEGFRQGNYLEIWSNQRGLVLFCYLICVLCGGYNYLTFQMMNVLAVNITYYVIYRFWKKCKIGGEDKIIIGIVIFLPITLYTGFVYGTTMGLVLSVWSILCQQMYLRERKSKYLLLSAVLITFAIVFKSNYLIFAIGISLVYFYDFFFEKGKKSIFGVLLIICCFFIMNGVVDKSLSIITDGVSDKKGGVPSAAWIVMGLQDEGRLGWYNGYNMDTYCANGYDTEKTKKACMEDLREVLEDKVSNPARTAEFFQKKVASMWCESSFSSLYNNKVNLRTNLAQGHSQLYIDLFAYSGRLHRVVYLFLEVYQSVIYLGALCYIINTDKKKDVSAIIGIIIFMGGVLFHLFWEAKSSYAFPYFVLLIPYAIMGIGQTFDKAEHFFAELRSKKVSSVNGILNAGIIVVAIIAVFMTGSFLELKDNREEWETFVAERRYISEGYYYLQPIEHRDVYVCADGRNGNDNLLVCREKEGQETDKLFLSVNIDGPYQYEFKNVQQESILIGDENCINMVSDPEDKFPTDAYWHWRFERLSGGYCVRWWNDMNKVLTYDAEDEKVYLTDYEEGNFAQIWRLVK